MANIFFDVKRQPVEKPSDAPVSWRISAYPLVKNSQGHILLVTPPWNNQWEMPGGGIAPDETIPEGVARECFEETGYRITVPLPTPFHMGEQFFYGHWSTQFFHSLYYMYEAVLVHERQDLSAINQGGHVETEKIDWLPIDALNETNCHPLHLAAIRAYLLTADQHLLASTDYSA